MVLNHGRHGLFVVFRRRLADAGQTAISFDAYEDPVARWSMSARTGNPHDVGRNFADFHLVLRSGQILRRAIDNSTNLYHYVEYVFKSHLRERVSRRASECVESTRSGFEAICGCRRTHRRSARIIRGLGTPQVPALSVRFGRSARELSQPGLRWLLDRRESQIQSRNK